MESWRTFFAGAGVDLWTVCERALALAYMNDLKGFPAYRDRLAQKLFAPEKFDFQVCDVGAPQLTGSNGNSSEEDLSKREAGSVEGCRHTPDRTYDEADALTEELDEEILLKRDVLDIKETLRDSYQSEREIFNLLRRLELMHLSFNVLRDTEIGKVVNSLRKHSSTRIVALAKQLVRGWKNLVQACCKSALDVATTATAERADTTGSGSLVVDEEEHGLPSPPMDEATLLVAQTASVEMLQLWDLMEDVTSAGSGDPEAVYNKPRYPKETTSKKESGSYAWSKNPHNDNCASGREKPRVSPKGIDANVSATGSDAKDERRNTYDGSPRRLDKGSMENKIPNHSSERRNDVGIPQRMQTLKPSLNLSCSDEKILAAKRNLRENYEREEHAKKQRIIQVLDLHDLPNGGGPGRAKNFHLRRGRTSSRT